MQPACLRQTELPHTSKLFADYTYHFDRVSRFYRHNPHDRNVFREASGEINYPDDRRRALTDALRVQNGDSEGLAKLAKPGTVAVVTGQQVGLFSGPAYTIYKALTAARLAQELNRQGIPAVPVFWLASEDHDFAEVNHFWTFGGEHRPQSLRVDGPSNGDRPVGGIALDHAPIQELRESLAAFPFGEEVAELVARAYPRGTTMAAGFRALLRSLLDRYGIVYIDALDPAVRNIAAPFLDRAHREAADLKARLIERNQQLEAAGYHTQVHLEEKTTLFFELVDGRRVKMRDNGIDPARLSPNALLRPVMQDYLLPTVAYVGGPAELAYLAQSEVLYEKLLGRMPVTLARVGFTLMDARAEKLLKRYRLTLTDVFVKAEELRERIAQFLVPAEVNLALEKTQAEVARQIDGLRAELDSFDHTLAAALEKSRAKILYQLDKVRHKSAREAIRRDQRASDDAAFLSGLLYPEEHLQERLYSLLPFLAKHGMDLLDRLYENVDLTCPDHRVLVV
jgi:uncharacterized protein YllA (UPF0747 family)